MNFASPNKAVTHTYTHGIIMQESKKTYKVIYQADNFGGFGWILSGFEGVYNATVNNVGEILAHDILEHNPETHDGSCESELKA